ncbi:MAG: citrate lyase subunit beta / citryl-CoA lyase [Clostridia bacterium]|nr:citrate lyase subunit beta / citryl-CoA lyase [Clostridia bacterium]
MAYFLLRIMFGGSSYSFNNQREVESLLLRSLLFIPGNKEKILLKTSTVNADAVVWDLEDAVPLAEKALARQLIRQHLSDLASPAPLVYVRANAVTTGLVDEDLRYVVGPNLTGIMLPKVETADEVRYVARSLVTLEKESGMAGGSVKIIATLETALGVLRAYDIAAASDRVEALCLGAEDFTRDLGTSRSREGSELAYARGAIVLAAAAARVAAIDTVFSDLNDEEGLEKECHLVRGLGFGGKCAIHPRQLDIINRAFSPTEEEVAYARRVVAAFEEARAQNLGVILVDGRMVDKPVVERAQRILERFGG